MKPTVNYELYRGLLFGSIISLALWAIIFSLVQCRFDRLDLFFALAASPTDIAGGGP